MPRHEPKSATFFAMGNSIKSKVQKTCGLRTGVRIYYLNQKYKPTRHRFRIRTSFPALCNTYTELTLATNAEIVGSLQLSRVHPNCHLSDVTNLLSGTEKSCSFEPNVLMKSQFPETYVPFTAGCDGVPTASITTTATTTAMDRPIAKAATTIQTFFHLQDI